MQSGTEKRAALAYARSQGWLPPGEVVRNEAEAGADAMRIADLERQLSDCRGEWSPLAGELEKAEGKIADLETALAAERESHEVTKKALLRAKGKGAGARIAALESMVRDLVDSIKFVGPVTGQPPMNEAEALAVDAAEALLKP